MNKDKMKLKNMNAMNFKGLLKRRTSSILLEENKQVVDEVEFDKGDVESLLDASIDPALIENQLLNNDHQSIKVDSQQLNKHAMMFGYIKIEGSNIENMLDQRN